MSHEMAAGATPFLRMLGYLARMTHHMTHPIGLS